MRSVPRVLTLILLAGIVAGCRTAGPDQPRLLRVVATDFALAAPATVPAGPTRVRLANQGGAWHDAMITRLPEGATAEGYVAGARAGEAFPVGAVDLGGPGLIAAGDSSEVVLQLEPGRYVIVCWSDNHVKRGMIATLTVTAPDDPPDSVAVVAVADASVTLLEFKFVHQPFRAGHQMLRVRNGGSRPHDMTFFRLAEGKSARDFGAWRRTREGPPPATPAHGTSTIAPGHEIWVTLDLEPGRYFVACGTPEGEQIHAQLGMIEEFEIPAGAPVEARR
jgi:uncharacterized cupredoxin-like copper-binding protein